MTTPVNLSELTIPQLKSLLAEIPNEIQRREKEDRIKARKELEALAHERGYSLLDLVTDTSGTIRQRRTVAAKYRHPQHPELQWTGRGRQPRWVADFLAAGGSLGQLAI